MSADETVRADALKKTAIYLHLHLLFFLHLGLFSIPLILIPLFSILITALLCVMDSLTFEPFNRGFSSKTTYLTDYER